MYSRTTPCGRPEGATSSEVWVWCGCKLCRTSINRRSNQGIRAWAIRRAASTLCVRCEKRACRCEAATVAREVRHHLKHLGREVLPTADRDVGLLVDRDDGRPRWVAFQPSAAACLLQDVLCTMIAVVSLMVNRAGKVEPRVASASRSPPGRGHCARVQTCCAGPASAHRVEFRRVLLKVLQVLIEVGLERRVAVV